MHDVLVTGAHGFVGSALSARLRRQLQAGELRSLTLTDRRPTADPAAASSTGDAARVVLGDLGDPVVLAQATAQAPDRVFHLAGVTSRQAEEQFASGLQTNVAHSMALFERLRAQGRGPRLVFASSIGVYGTPMPARIDDDTVPAPGLSYGTQKRMVELLLADYSRRGWIDGRALRLPSIVARPADPGGALSAFASDLIREPAQGRRYVCPIGPDGSVWWLSLPACVDHLLLAATLPSESLPSARAWNLPALRATAAEVVQALGRRLHRDPAQLVDYQPQAALQAQFANWPPLHTAIADRLGFRHDGDLDRLLDRALDASHSPSPSPAP